MPTKLDVGGIIYQFGVGVASLNFTPLADRAAIVKRINISNPSAKDNWQVIVGGREIMRVRHSTVGNQQPFELAPPGSAPNPDFLTYCRNFLKKPADIPVPLGLTLTIQSVGGATADIDIEAIEVDKADADVVAVNHYLGKHFLLPLQWYLNASQSAAALGTVQMDTQVGPPWIPNLFNGTQIPTSWQFQLLALFLEGAGVNTFSGAANHQSTTQGLLVNKNGTPLYSRTTTGVPNRGKASAAGSANTVFGQQSGVFPPIVLADFDDDALLAVPLTLRAGDYMTLSQILQGDGTGGASYLDALVTAVVDVIVPSGAGQV